MDLGLLKIGSVINPSFECSCAIHLKNYSCNINVRIEICQEIASGLFYVIQWDEENITMCI